MFSQQGARQTHQSVLEISRNTWICWSSVGRIIHSQPPTQRKRMCLLSCQCVLG